MESFGNAECRVQSAKRKVQDEEGVRLSEGIV